jgi:tetratricopeptide (TPR) repeat protein
MSHSKPASSPYQSKFKSYLLQNLAYLHQEVQHAAPIPEEEVRTQAMHTLSYALKIGEAWSPTRDLFLILAPPMEQAGHREDWIPYLLRALERSMAADDQSAAAEFHLQLALLYRLLSQFKAAHEHIAASIDLFASRAEARNQARALNERAWLEHLQHRYEEASRHVEQAIGLLEEDDSERAMSYRVQGMIAIGFRQWEEAKHYHHLALTLFEKHHDQRRIAWSLQNLAYVLREQQQYAEAIELFKQAGNLLRQVDDRYHTSIVLFNLGLTYSACNQVPKAITYYKEAEEIFYKLNNKLYLARLYTDWALDALSLQDYTGAELLFKQSIGLFKELGDESWRLNAMDGLAITYLAQQDHVRARSIVDEALQALAKAIHIPNYDYLYTSLTKHWLESSRDQETPNALS